MCQFEVLLRFFLCTVSEILILSEDPGGLWSQKCEQKLFAIHWALQPGS